MIIDMIDINSDSFNFSFTFRYFIYVYWEIIAGFYNFTFWQHLTTTTYFQLLSCVVNWNRSNIFPFGLSTNTFLQELLRRVASNLL